MVLFWSIMYNWILKSFNIIKILKTLKITVHHLIGTWGKLTPHLIEATVDLHVPNNGSHWRGVDRMLVRCLGNRLPILGANLPQLCVEHVPFDLGRYGSKGCRLAVINKLFWQLLGKCLEELSLGIRTRTFRL